MALAPNDPRHGTANGYTNQRCRCDACRVAIREYSKARGIGGYARDLCACGNEKAAVSKKCMACYRSEVEAPHGTEGRYINQGCHCDECRRAATAAKRRRREASRVPCSHGCGTMVDSINRRNPDKPPECWPCAMRRIAAERRAAALAGGPEVSELAYRIVLHTFLTTEPVAPREIAEITMGDIVGHLAATLDADEADVLRALAELQQVGALETDR